MDLQNTFKPDNPIIFIHGAWHASWCWEEHFIPYFIQHGYSGYALNLIGHSSDFSSTAINTYTINNYVEDVLFKIKKSPNRPILIGHSMGSFIIQKVLEIYDPAAAILLAPMPVNGVLKPLLRTFSTYPIGVIKSFLSMDSSRIFDKTEMVKKILFSEGVSSTKIRAYNNKLQPESIKAIIDMLFLKSPLLKKTNCPLLVLCAEEDTLIKPREVQSVAQFYNADFKSLPEMGHDIMLENNWILAAEYMLKWLDFNLLSNNAHAADAKNYAADYRR